MKTLVYLLFLSIALCVSFNVHAQANLPDALQGNPLEDKMVGGMPANPFAAIHGFDMEGIVKDSMTGIPGRPFGHLLPVDGFIGRALHFDGASHAEVPIDLLPTTMPDMTIAMMVKADAIPEDPDDLSAVPTSGYIFTDGDSYIILNNQKKTSAFLSAYTAKALVYDSATFQVPHEIWHMVAMTRKIEKRTNDEGLQTDHTILQFYVNGRLKEAVADIGNVAALNTKPPLIKFAAYGERSTKLRGAIDEVVVYDRALGKDELDELRDFWRQAAGNEWFLNRNGARPIEASPGSQLPTQVEGSTSTDGSQADRVMFGNEPPGGELNPGPGEPSISDPPDRFGQPPNAGDILDDVNANAQQRDAAAQVGIENSQILDGNVPGTGGSELGPSVPTADDAEAFISSEEGQQMLRAVDWRIDGIMPNSIDKSTVYPGDEVTLRITVSKDDPGNKIPDVVLSIDGTQSLPFRVMTSEQVPTQSRDIPVTLTVPSNIPFGSSADETKHTFEARILTAEEGPLVDANPRNHSRLFGIVVSRPILVEPESQPETPQATALTDWSGGTSACQSVGEFMTDAWEYMDEVVTVVCTGVIVGAEPAVLEDGGLAKTYRKCSSTTKKVKKGTEKAVSLFNDLADNSWATLGPRELRLNQQNTGQLVYPGDRKFISAVPIKTETVKLNIRELAGKAQTEVIVCTKSEDGAVRRLNKNIVFNFNKTSSKKLQDETFLLGDVQDKFISVLLQTDFNENLAISNVAPRFKYRLRVDEQQDKE